MASEPNTNDALSGIGTSAFEELVAWYLRETYPHLRGLIATGINDDGKPIACPVDGIQYIPGSPSRCVSVAVTTEVRRNLSGKWLGQSKKVGDIDKAGKDFAVWKTEQRDIICELYIATNRHLGSDVSLYRKAVERGRSHDIGIHVVEASSLLHFLDNTREGHYARWKLLGIPITQLGEASLRAITSDSLKLHGISVGWASQERQPIQRVQMTELRSMLTPGGEFLVQIEGAAGTGKSTLLRQIGEGINNHGGCSLWLPGECVVIEAPLSATLQAAFLRLCPSLGALCAEEVRQGLHEKGNSKPRSARSPATAHELDVLSGQCRNLFDPTRARGSLRQTTENSAEQASPNPNIE